MNGTLKIFTTADNESMPVPETAFAITDKNGKVLYQGVTNENGESEVFKLDADPNVWIGKHGYASMDFKDVQIFDGGETVLPVDMLALPRGADEELSLRMPPIAPGNIPSDVTVTNPTVPDYVNINELKVPFIDYIKNAASGSIDPTQPTADIIEKIHDLVTDTVKNGAKPANFIRSRNIPQNISQITDGVLNVYRGADGKLAIAKSNFAPFPPTQQDVQQQLARIRLNFPGIPQTASEQQVLNPDAVKVFQRIFNLSGSGTADRSTWNRIQKVYKSIINR